MECSSLRYRWYGRSVVYGVVLSLVLQELISWPWCLRLCSDVCG